MAPTIRRGFTLTSTAPTTVMAMTAPTAGPNNARPKIPAERCRWALIAGIRAAQVPDTLPTRKNTAVTASRRVLGDRSNTTAWGDPGVVAVELLRGNDSLSDTIDRQSRQLQSAPLRPQQPLEVAETTDSFKGDFAQLRPIARRDRSSRR